MQLHTKNRSTKPSGRAKVGTKYCVTSGEVEVFGGGLEEGFMKAATSFPPGLRRHPHTIIQAEFPFTSPCDPPMWSAWTPHSGGGNSLGSLNFGDIHLHATKGLSPAHQRETKGEGDEEENSVFPGCSCHQRTWQTYKDRAEF